MEITPTKSKKINKENQYFLSTKILKKISNKKTPIEIKEITSK
jgi:hypothetical protein